MNVKSMPGGYTPFNHGYLCQMLRSATAEELLNVVKDVRKEQERREAEKKNEYLNNIRKAISDAIHAGYAVDFYYSSDSADLAFSAHANNEYLYEIDLSTDE